MVTIAPYESLKRTVWSGGRYHTWNFPPENRPQFLNHRYSLSLQNLTRKLSGVGFSRDGQLTSPGCATAPKEPRCHTSATLKSEPCCRALHSNNRGSK